MFDEYSHSTVSFGQTRGKKADRFELKAFGEDSAPNIDGIPQMVSRLHDSIPLTN